MPVPEMTEAVFEILRSAVNLARNEQIRNVPALKARLLSFYPGHEDDLNQAIYLWAQYVQVKGPATLVGRPG